MTNSLQNTWIKKKETFCSLNYRRVIDCENFFDMIQERNFTKRRHNIYVHDISFLAYDNAFDLDVADLRIKIFNIYINKLCDNS